MKVLVYYHNDMDGRCSAAIVKKALGDKDVDYTFVPMGYNNSVELPKNIHEYWRVYIVDFTMNEEIMDQLCTLFPRNDVIWIEHHITAIEQYGEKYSHFEGMRKDGTAACLLTWQFFYGQLEAPMAVKFVADRDMWYFKLEGTKRFYEYMMNQNQDPKYGVWDHYLDKRSDLYDEIEMGGTLRSARMRSIEKDAKYLGYESELDGHKCMKINYSSFESVSDMGHYICDKLGYDIAWIYYQKKNNNGEMIQVNNLRSKEIDVSEIAKSRGGGGHKLAAGFASMP